MRRQRWWLPLVALAFIANLKSTLTLPVPDEEVDTSPKLLGSSVVTSVSVVTGSSDNVDNENSMRADSADRMRVMPSEQMLGSPADLLRPDRFQFYTLNKEGDVVTRQMTEQEIQSLIAAGGGHLPMEIHEPQKAGDVPAGGMKVSDVVQNVQNVLKGELNKPPTVMTSVPTIPGHVNTEWSSILPAILGGETDTAPVDESDPPMPVDISEAPIIADTTLVKVPEPVVIQTTTTKLPTKEPTSSSSVFQESTERPAEILETETHGEKPMIQIPVITVDQKLPSHQEEEDSMPVFQMLNTISADKVNAKNSTNNKDKPKPVASQHTDLEQTEIAVKTEKPTIKPDSVTESIIEVSTAAKDDPSEMIEINLNSDNDKPSVVADTKKPVLKPESGIITAEMMKTPESESPTILTVVSETHSTSMKVSGHEEIPLREPPKPVMESTDHTRLPSETKNPEKVTEKSPVISTTEAMSDVTTLKAEAPLILAQPTESSTDPGLFAQGVSFFGNLPQTVSSIVSDFISNNTPSSTPVVGDAKLPVKNSENANEPVGATDSVKIIEATKPPAGQTTVASTRETVTSTTESTVKQEPVFQLMPEIIPDKKVPSHGAMPSEASSIEHIIETLSDPTGSLSGTVAADHYVVHKKPENKLNVTKVDTMQAETVKPLSVSQTKTSTAATPVSVKTPLESSSTKPMAPLPTELADSLSSMISQISDAMPSVLPVSENAGLDTTEKKNGNADAEEPDTTEIIETTTTRKVSKTTEAPVKIVHLPVEAETETPVTEKPTTKAPERQNPTITTNVAVEESTEKLKVRLTTEVPASEPVTTQASKNDISTTVKSDVPLASQELLVVPVNKIDESVAQTVETPDPKPEKSKTEVDEVQASSDITTDKVIVEAVAQESVKTEAVTESAATDSTTKKSSTGKPATTIASSTMPAIAAEQTEIPIKVQTDNPAITQDSSKPESLQTETPTKIESDENKTEQSIVRIDITEAKPTQFIHANKSQEPTSVDDGAESPLVRIKLTDPIGIINHMIASANVDVTPSPVAPLVLPAIGSAPPNTIASGLIAGFPSSTTQATKISYPDPEENLTTNAPVKVLPEVQIVNDAPASEVTEEVKTSEIQVESSTKAETPETVGPNKEPNVTASNEDSKMSSPKNVTDAPDIPMNEVHLPSIPVIVESPEKASTQITVNPQISMDKPKIEEPIAETTPSRSADTEVSTTLPTTQSPLENVATTTKLIKNEAVGVEETTMKVHTSLVDEPPANPIEILASSVVQQPEPDDKLLNEASKIIETAISTTLKAEVTTAEPVSTESKTQNSGIQLESTSITKSEVPDVRIDVAPEKLPDDLPSKIQLTDLPIVQTILPTKKPLNDGIQTLHPTQNPQLVTTMESIVDSSKNNEENPGVPLQETAASTVEKATTEAVEEIPKLEEIITKPEKTETSGDAILPESIPESLNPIAAPQQTEEVRIQVNDTAVLVTKRPVADSSIQKLEDIQKTLENEAINEQPTTSKIATPVTEEPSGKLVEKIVLPVPVKISELSSHEEIPENPSITKVVNGAIGTETRIRLGEEQVHETKGDKLPEKIDDPRKPIKKNNDGNALPNEGQPMLPESTTRTPSVLANVTSANLEKDSNVQSTTEGRIIMSVSFNQVSNFSKVNEPVTVQEKPSKLPEKKTPIQIVTERPIPKPVKLAHKPTMNIKKDDGAPRPAEEQWTLIPQQVYPALIKPGSHAKRPVATEEPASNFAQNDQKMNTAPPRTPVSLDHPQSANGLDSTVKDLETDISYFANLCNELAFSFWTATNKGLSTARSLAVSPFGMTSMLAMVFLGARGPTSDQMNDILKLDDVASFNPHLVFQNVTDAVGLARNQGIANAAFVRELFADRSKVRKLMPFYKEQAQQFYDGIVAEVNFATISDLVRRRTNLMIRKQTGGRIKDFVRTNTVPLRSPLAALSANVFQTDCNSSAASSEGRDGELYFAVSPAVRQRKLVPVPATVWRAGVLAGYEPSLDATAVALGGTEKLVSTIFVIPGQQGHTAPGDTLDRLEQRIIKGVTHDGSWNKLLKILIPRPGLELQVPKFSHRSVINATAALKRMGLEELFSKHADLKGINGIATDLHLADVLQMNLFSTCGDENIISGRHHVEVYPGSPLRNAREYEFEEQTDDQFTDYFTEKQQHPAPTGSAIPYVLNREARSARQNDGTEKQRLKLDRPFLYFVRHNPTGLILHMGRFNPRLLP